MSNVTKAFIFLTMFAALAAGFMAANMLRTSRKLEEPLVY